MENVCRNETFKRNAVNYAGKIDSEVRLKGCTNKEIAHTLSLSTETVKKHLQNIYRKLNAGNKIEALQKAGMI